MQSGALSSERLVQLYLARIAAYEDGGPKLNAILSLNSRAAEQAAALDRERAAKGARGPLHGIPVLLKDNVDTYDMPTSNGSAILRNAVPPDDAAIAKLNPKAKLPKQAIAVVHRSDGSGTTFIFTN